MKVEDLTLKQYIYINSKIIKFLLWEYWIGGEVKVGNREYLVTQGLLRSGIDKWVFLAPVPKILVMRYD